MERSGIMQLLILTFFFFRKKKNFTSGSIGGGWLSDPRGSSMGFVGGIIWTGQLYSFTIKLEIYTVGFLSAFSR